MVGPRRPLRRSITPGTLKRTEQPILPLRETGDGLGRQVRMRRPSGRPISKKAARSLRTGFVRCCMAGSAGERLAARSARRGAPVGAAQRAAGPSVTASRSPSLCSRCSAPALSLPKVRQLSAWLCGRRFPEFVRNPYAWFWQTGVASLQEPLDALAQDRGRIEQPVERPMTKSAALDAIEAAWKIARLSPWRISSQAPR